MISDKGLSEIEGAKEYLDDIVRSFDVGNGLEEVSNNLFQFLDAIELMGVPVETVNEDGDLLIEGVSPLDIKTFILQNGGDEKAGQQFIRLVKGFRFAAENTIKKSDKIFIEDKVWYKSF